MIKCAIWVSFWSILDLLQAFLNFNILLIIIKWDFNPLNFYKVERSIISEAETISVIDLQDFVQLRTNILLFHRVQSGLIISNLSWQLSLANESICEYGPTNQRPLHLKIWKKQHVFTISIAMIVDFPCSSHSSTIVFSVLLIPQSKMFFFSLCLFHSRWVFDVFFFHSPHQMSVWGIKVLVLTFNPTLVVLCDLLFFSSCFSIIFISTWFDSSIRCNLHGIR